MSASRHLSRLTALVALLSSAPLAIASVGSPDRAGEPIPGQYVVQLQLPVVQQVLGRLPLRSLISQLLLPVTSELPFQVYEHAFPGFAIRLSPQQAAQLDRIPGVHVEQDQVMSAQARTTVSTSLYGLDRIDQLSGTNSTYSYPSLAGQGVNVYVIDTGLRSTHIEFTGRVGTGRNFAPNSSSLLGASTDAANTTDCDGHGTHVAGTVLGSSYGVARSATIHPIRVLGCDGSGSNSGVIAGIDWMIANHRKPAVGNMSLGGAASSTLDTAVRNAISNGITMVVAAGNENTNACNGSPNRVTEALVVAASTAADRRASYSNYGSCVDLFAPGDAIRSAGISSDSASATLSGTSMAAPHVAGAAALYLASRPSQSPAQVASDLLQQTSVNRITDVVGSPNRLLHVGVLEDDANFVPGDDPDPVEPPPPAVPCTGCTAYTITLDGTARNVLAPNSNGFSFSGGTLRGYLMTGSVKSGSIGIALERRVSGLFSTSWQAVSVSPLSGTSANQAVTSGNLASGTYRWRLSTSAGSGTATFYGQPR